MKRVADIALTLIVTLLSLASFSSGQVATGTPPFGSFGGGPFDAINLGNLDVHFAIAVLHKAGRGLPFTYDISYDSSVWNPVTVSGATTWQPVANWGWRGATEIATGYISYNSLMTRCPGTGIHDGLFYITLFGFIYHDPYGTQHPFAGSAILGADCPTDNSRDLNASSTDGSGYKLFFPGGDSSTPQTLTTPSGQNFIPPSGGASTGAAHITDGNGNQISVDSSGHFTDTLNTTALTVTGSGTATSPMNFTYTAPSGAAASYTMNFTNFNVKTNFGCSGISEYNATNMPLVTSINLPDGSHYTFTYEPTPGSSGFYTGRLASVTVPTGGVINYSYTGANNGIICADGSAAGLTRTLNPGGAWTYARTLVSGAHWTTTITDPDTPTHNQTVIDFQKDSTATTPTNNFYETQRVSYQGTIGGTVLRTTLTCYNGNGVASPSSCPTTAVSLPILRTSVFTYLPIASGLQAETNTIYDNFGLVDEVDEYDYGSAAVGPLTRKTITTYAGGMSNGIVDRPSSVVTQDGGSVTKASTSYLYDETTPVSSGVTQQHVSITGSRGNLTTVNAQANGTTHLYRKFTYFDTGSLNTSTDLSTSSSTNGALTTYNYTAGTASCNNTFPTSISEPLSNSRSMTWNCTGGALLSVTDENGKISSASYTDSFFWRPASVTDQASNVTSINYSTATRTESTMTFNSGNSVSGHLIQLDGFGRVIVSQTRQAPGSSSYDSVETDYDVVGRVSKVTLSYSAAAGALCSGTCPGTTFGYDALGRVSSATDGGGGSVGNGYTKNYVSQTLSPAPTGENTKQKEMVFDAMGRLTSVCEITSGTGTGPCQAGSSPTGYWTTYAYDVLNNLTGVTQNAQAAVGSRQTRTYAYDMLGRLTSEANPEANNVASTYSYDTSATGCTNVNPAGNFTKRVNADGNATCYNYDTVHRVTSILYPSSSTPTKNFVYDTATVNGTAMANAKARLAEAYTCTSCPGTKITDLGFSYSARGEVTDTWQSSPNSGGYYHLTAAYWPHGALKSIAGLAAMPTIYYGASDGTGLDGEGRITKVTASSGQNPVTAATYSPTNVPVGFLTNVTYGSGDSDAFTPDSNTGRLAQYQFKMGTSNLTDTGALTWNANGSLRTLAITDQINSLNTQTCNYTYDDLARVKTANCGSAWNQTFSFDPFGNINKTATVGTSFLPTYNLTTNRIQSLSGCAISYDANGNPLQDCARGSQDSYTWDGEGKPATIDGVSFVFDALGRGVEVNAGSNHVPIVYSPTGEKLAQFTGSVLYRGYVPLPGGGKAVYLSSGLGFYYHPDWLGSGRLATTPSRTSYQDVAYAPYGEDYAKIGATYDQSFTGQTQDDLSAMYDFLYRNYSPITGRWFSPDPAGLAAVDPADPQSWNRYGYVGNRPLNTVDPLGLVTCIFCGPGDPGGGGCDPFDPFCGSPAPCELSEPCGNPCDFPGACGPSQPPIGGGGGPIGGGGAPGGGGRRIGGKWPNGETLGLPKGLNLKPMTLADLLGLSPSATIGSGFVAGIDDAIEIYAAARGLAFLALLASEIYDYRLARREQRLIEDIARRFCVDRHALGDAIEDEKRRSGRGPADNLTKKQIEDIARTLPKIPGCVPTSI